MALQRIGILGGTFDPIHYGHLRIAESAREAFQLERVLFVPNAVSPFKTGERAAPAEDRYAMTALAIASNPAFAVSRAEIDRPPPSYAIDTVRAIRNEYPKLDTLYFITGRDTIAGIPRWRDWQKLITLCRVIAVTRPGYETIPVPEYADVLDAPGLQISGTDLRARARAGRSLKYLVPDEVRDYILQRNVYHDR